MYPINVSEVMQAATQYPVTHWRTLGMLLNPPHRGEVIQTKMRNVGEAERIETIFAENKEKEFEAERMTYLMYIHLLSVVLERTPDEKDINSFGPPTHSAVAYFCGSVYDAQQEAGLLPNPRGGNRPRDPRAQLAA